MIRRRELDAWLLDEARRAGATIVESVAVDEVFRNATGAVCGVRTRRADEAPRQIAARVVVGADGASSVVARAVGAFARRPEHTCVAGRAYVSNVSLPAPYLEVFTSDRTLPGCAWIVPVGPREASVGIGVMQTTANRLGQTPRELFEGVRRESPLLAERLRGAGEVNLSGWVLPGAGERRRLAGPGWILVGDAGAMVDPFTGHGIQNAIAAGALAGPAIAESLSGHDPVTALARYEANCREAFTADVERGSWLRYMHAHPRVMRAAVAACARHAGLRATFLALVGHAAPRTTLLAPAALVRAAATFRESGVAA